jgi:prophage regulatory protein
MRIIRRRELTAKVGYCLGHIYRLERAGEFPPRVRLGRRAVGWVAEEVERWLQERVDARDRAGAVTAKARLQADRAEVARFVEAGDRSHHRGLRRKARLLPQTID